MLPALPIDRHVAEIVDLVRRRGAAVVTAPPGAGKTTRLPPALAADGPCVLLQPRRVAARSLAARIAVERGWTVGQEVGWQVRFERRFSERTQLLVATEGVLTARLQSDPLLSTFRTVVLDEFHERSLHADLALALVRQAARARGDLRIVVMSATLDPRPVADFLGGAPVVEIAGTPYPVQVLDRPGVEPQDAITEALSVATGHVLCFLPGAPEIRRVQTRVAGAAARHGARVLPLYGALDASAQDAALAPSAQPKVILATNIAETSLTVEGVTDVVDSGLHKVLRRDPRLGMDRLEVERISRDSAEQRAGRAGRTAPGRAWRLWDPRAVLRARREPEIERVDLAGPLLDVLGWGGDPRSFEWFEAPPAEAVATTLELLERLGAVADGRITESGRRLAALPLHPRLGALLLAAGGARDAARACAALAERWTPAGEPSTTSSDLLTCVDRWREAPDHVRRAAAQLVSVAHAAGVTAGAQRQGDGAHDLLRAILAAFPDRVAARRERGSPRLVLANGTGAVLDRTSGVRDGDWLVALDVVLGERGPGSEARVRSASRIEREWLEPTSTEVVHRLSADGSAVLAFERRRYLELVLDERQVEPDRDIAGGILAEAILSERTSEADVALLRRLRYAGVELDLAAAVREQCRGVAKRPSIDLAALLDHKARETLARLAPETLEVPSGRHVRLDYREDGTVALAVKLQELFGLAETPRIGPRREPVLLELLAPSGRPVQATRDLRGFWERTYAEVRRELRGRYPKHPWPEDPWSAPPTARTKRRK